jgi:hypothetical protein
MSKEAQYTYITLVQAPEIPESERKTLEAHWREAILDPSYTVVVNYECRANLIVALPGNKLLVTAPGLPTSEVRKLAKKVDKARNGKREADRLVVVNHECRIDVVN